MKNLIAILLSALLALSLSACSTPPPPPDAPLENTYWKLMEIGGRPAQVFHNQREAHFVLQKARKGVGGSSGCNRLTGSYTLEGAQLRFGPMAGTRMACLQGAEQERLFLETLPEVARWHITGNRLDLLDAQGAVLASFEARYMP